MQMHCALRGIPVVRTRYVILNLDKNHDSRYSMPIALPNTLCALLLLTLTACSSTDMLARRIAEPEPITRRQLQQSVVVYHRLQAPSQRLSLPGGPTLSYRILRPANYGFHFTLRQRSDALRFKMRFDEPDIALPDRGTIVALHGWSLDGSSLLPWALGFAERGYRVVLVDLRSHGLSGKALVGYGSREGADVATLVRALRMRGEATGPLTLFGVSYGAVSSIHAAAELGAAIHAVVALEPFANAGEGIRDLMHGVLQRKSRTLRGRLIEWYLRQRVDEATIAAAVPRAGRLLHLNLDAVDTRTAMRRLTSCALLLHGDADTLLPPTHSRQLSAVNARAHLRELPDQTHLSLPLRVDWLLEPIASWLAQTASSEDCPAFALPAAPVAGDDGETHLDPPAHTVLPGPWRPAH